MSRPFLRVAAPRLLTFAAIFQSAALAQLDSTPSPILPDLRYAAPLDLDGDGRDEIVGVSHANNALVAYALDSDRKPVFARRLADLGSTETRAGNRWSLRLADMDGDGRDDLVQTDLQGLYVFYERGGPQYDERVLVDTFTTAHDVSVVDFDADGDLDFLIYPRFSSSINAIRWSENLGGGAFATFVVLPSGADNYGLLQPVDLDNDGDLDLVGFQGVDDTPVVVRNQNGAFQVEPIPGAIPGASVVQAEDIDSDGLVDLLVRRDITGASMLDLYRGSPGGFLPPTLVLDSPDRLDGQLTFANLDGTGDDELICQLRTPGLVETSIVVFEWSSQGVFLGPIEKVDFEIDENISRDLQTADLDGDGKEDLLIRAGDVRLPNFLYYPFGPRFLLGATDSGVPALEGPFRAMEFSPEGLEQTFPTYFANDLDSDGVLDLTRVRQGELQWLRGSAGSVQFSPPTPIAGALEIKLIADLNGDGAEEVVVSETSTGVANLSLIPNLGGGSFGAPMTIAAGLDNLDSVSLIALDFDGDGDLDLFPAPDSQHLLWFENLGNLSFAPPAAIAASAPTAFARLHAGDFDGDGDIDLLEVTLNDLLVTSLGWFEGLGGGTFGPRQALVQFPLATPAVVDVNEDGIDDVVYTDGQGTFALVGDPAGLGAAGAPVLVLGTRSEGPIELIDINGDGQSDFVEARRLSSTGTQLAYIRVGPLDFSAPGVVLAPNRVRLRDFGGDGDLDGLGTVKDFDWQGQIDVIYEGLGRGISGMSYCGPAAPNSSGLSASILALGTNEAQLNELKLRVNDAGTNTFGFFLVSPVSQPATPVIGSAGRLCLGGAIGRYVAPGQVQSTGLTGSFELNLDLTAIPTPTVGPVAALPGATWYFQAWFRDFASTGPTSNFSDGVEVTFE